MSRRKAPEAVALEPGSPRECFAGLLAEAAEEAEIRPSELALAYLVDLLEARLRGPAEAGRAREDEPTLGEAFLAARLETGAAGATRLRALGDRALFVAGFFGDSLARSLVDIDYYAGIGRAAYGQVSCFLARRVREQSWPQLFEELADDFLGFVELLAEVGDRTRPDHATDLLRTYERYARTGSPRERARLLRRGLVPPPSHTLRRWQ